MKGDIDDVRGTEREKNGRYMNLQTEMTAERERERCVMKEDTDDVREKEGERRCEMNLETEKTREGKRQRK
jgi:hypothetical protein